MAWRWSCSRPGRDARRFLLGAHSIAAHAAAVAALLAWNAYFTHGAQSASTGVDILLKIKSVDLGDYLHQLWSFPPETVLRLAPASLVFVYYWWRTRAAAPAAAVEGFPWRTLLAMLVLNYLPYWLGPKTHIRYIMPLYPLAALALAAAIWNFGAGPRIIAARWFVAAVVLRYAIGLWIFPWYQDNYRGHYAATAAEIAATDARVSALRNRRIVNRFERDGASRYVALSRAVPAMAAGAVERRLRFELCAECRVGRGRGELSARRQYALPVVPRSGVPGATSCIAVAPLQAAPAKSAASRVSYCYHRCPCKKYLSTCRAQSAPNWPILPTH
jgi:hypothetical protein